MPDDDRANRITEVLLAFGKTIPKESLFPTIVPEAASIVATDPYAFLIATCLDRGALADVIWTIPYDMKGLLGHLDPRRIHAMSAHELDELFKQIPRKPHYRKDAIRTVQELTRKVVDEYGGDASKIWQGKTAGEVHRELDSIFGVADGIASMGVLLIELAFDVRFPDRARMGIKADTHTIRVLYRLGLSDGKDEEGAVLAARRMNPEFPGGLDAPLWEIGRRWCHPSVPDCPACVMGELCAKRQAQHLNS